MYGLKTGGAILQVLSLLFGILGVLLGVVSAAAPYPYNAGALPAILTSIVGGFVGFVLGAAAQALAVIAENSDDQVRLLAKLAKELPPSTRQMAKQPKMGPTYKQVEKRSKDNWDV